MVPEDLDEPETPELVAPAMERLPTAEDLTDWPALGLAVLATVEIDDLEPLTVPREDLVAVEVLVEGAPVLERVMEELLTPADLEVDPIPFLVVEPVVETLGL